MHSLAIHLHVDWWRTPLLQFPIWDLYQILYKCYVVPLSCCGTNKKERGGKEQGGRRGERKKKQTKIESSVNQSV